jgi:hypothetical protein
MVRLAGGGGIRSTLGVIVTEQWGGGTTALVAPPLVFCGRQSAQHRDAPVVQANRFVREEEGQEHHRLR